MIRFRVNGTPAPQGSKRHVGGGRMVESSRAVGPWREAVRAEAQRAGDAEWGRGLWGPTSAPVTITAVFVLARPAGHFSKRRFKAGETGGRPLLPSAPHFPAGRPDVDKLARAVLDGLVMGGVMADDAQVVTLTARKVYAENGQAPGVLIEVEAL